MTIGRVLVTGAGGFVGRHVIPLLLQRGFEVHTISREAIGSAPDMVIQHHADLLDPEASGAIMRAVRPTHWVHLAWNVKPGEFWRAADNLDWVATTLLLYRAFAASGGRRVLVTGTCAEYDWQYDQLDEATTPCRPSTLYGSAKHALHQIIAAAGAQDNVEVAWVRLFFLYGPHEAASRLVPDVILSLLRGQPARCGDGLAMRDFMHVEDVAGALVHVMNSTHVGAVNIASGECVPIRDVVLELAAAIGRPDLVRLGARPPVPGDPPKLGASVEVLHDKLGFRPAYTRARGLAATVAWWRKAQSQGAP